MEEKDGVLVTELQQLFSGILKEDNVTVVEGVSELESIDCISTSGHDLVVDLSGGLSVLVKVIVELDILHKSHL
jgi:hypothetical protein